MNIRSLDGTLDSALSVTITLMCIVGTFVLSRYALAVIFR